MSQNLGQKFNLAVINAQLAEIQNRPEEEQTALIIQKRMVEVEIYSALTEVMGPDFSKVACVTILGEKPGDLTSFNVGTFGGHDSDVYLEYSHLTNASEMTGKFDMRKLVEIKPAGV